MQAFNTFFSILGKAMNKYQKYSKMVSPKVAEE